MKIALTIPTGRPNVKNVVEAFIDNAVLHGYDPKQFSVYLAVDTKFQNTKLKDFKLYQSTLDKVGSVVYVDENKRKEISNSISKKLNIDDVVSSEMFDTSSGYGHTYSKLRNSGLLMAMYDGNDVSISVDDDEAPFIPTVKNGSNKLYWKNLDFWTPHISAFKNGVDVTSGQVAGYLSPIPSELERNIPLKLRERLGAALSTGNEVINSDSFINIMSQIKYVNQGDLERAISDNNVSLFCGGNMGVNLNSMREGKVPIFYTPPAARGEDTIFALQLENAKFEKVNSYIFHDPFNMYPDIFEGAYPASLGPIPFTENSKDRFGSALLGWLKYAPMLLKMTEADKEFLEKKGKMLKEIQYPTEKLSEMMECPLISESFSTLNKYFNNVERDYKNLKKIQTTWKDEILPNMYKLRL